MASINTANNNKIYSISRFYGLVENPDGDTKLKFGEASICRNWRVTRDGNLQRRPGQKTVCHLCDAEAASAVKGLWSGKVAGAACILAACNGHLYKVYDEYSGYMTDENREERDLGAIDTSRKVFIFPFSNKAYIMTGSSYMEWDGTTLTNVIGYIPLVSVSIGPQATAEAAGSTLEQVNKLTPKRRAWISPNGEGTVFCLPESPIQSVDYVKNLRDGSIVSSSDYDINTYAGTVTFHTAPTRATNSYEIGWTVASSDAASVRNMQYEESYSGVSNNRAFLYGDGTNRIFYSGLDYDGNPRADYFPDLNVITVGDANTPITGVAKHYSKLIAFKEDSTWAISYGNLTLSDGSAIPAYYAVSINKEIGNRAPGQIMLVMNTLRSLFGRDLYEWRSTSSRDANLTADERNARRISDRIYSTLGGFDLRSAVCWDDNYNQEYYIAYNGNALVHNYAVDAWYLYSDFDAVAFCNIGEELITGTSDGRIVEVSIRYRDDDGAAISAYWESGSISYGVEYMKKYSSEFWISVKPQSSSFVEVTIMTDRNNEFATKALATGTGGFADLDFASFSFADVDRPQVKRLKMKAKKFAFYKLVFKSEKPRSAATILSASINVRTSGYVK